MNAHTNRQAVQQIDDAFHQGDIGSIPSASAADVAWHQPGPADVLPWAGTRHGRAQVAQFCTAVGETLDLLQCEPRGFLAQGGKVAVFGDGQALAEPTHHTFGSEWGMAFPLRDGQAVRFRADHDTAAMVTALRSLTTYHV